MNNFGNGRTVCSFCGEDISANAKRCPYCGSLLASDNSIKSDEVKDDLDSSFSQIQDKRNDPYENSFDYDSTVNSEDYTKGFSYQERDYGDDVQEELSERETDEKLNDIEKPSDTGAFNIGGNQAQQGVDYVPKVKNGDGLRQQGYQGFGVSGQNTALKPSISNAMKVFITSICSLVPGLGQLIGVIIAIVFMNSEGDTDKRSFGVALLVNSLIVFVVSCLACCVLIAVFSES